jgi:hypothetical protein
MVPAVDAIAAQPAGEPQESANQCREQQGENCSNQKGCQNTASRETGLIGRKWA